MNAYTLSLIQEALLSCLVDVLKDTGNLSRQANCEGRRQTAACEPNCQYTTVQQICYRNCSHTECLEKSELQLTLVVLTLT